jgi:hypothetical protein
MSGGGAVALGSSVTLTNAGVTSLTAGTGISLSGSTGGVTISSSGASGTVTSVATNNGLTGGTITTSGTIGLDVYNGSSYNYTSYAIGTTLLLGAGVTPTTFNVNAALPVYAPSGACAYAKGILAGTTGYGPAISGTWRVRGQTDAGCGRYFSLMTRTA